MRLQPGDPPAQTLGLVAAVAMHEAASGAAPAAPLMLKWPNDLMAGGAKLGGVLLDRQGECVVVGFGVNLAACPAGLCATSLAAVAGRAPPPAAFLDALAAAFARWLGLWRGEGLASIRASWLASAHPPGTALVTHDREGGSFSGIFEGLDESGGLKLRLADGTTHVMHAGDVFLD